jgi:hypothetical protein
VPSVRELPPGANGRALVREFNELAEVDAALAPSERDSVGLVIGLRPYVLSLFMRMKRGRKRG